MPYMIAVSLEMSDEPFFYYTVYTSVAYLIYSVRNFRILVFSSSGIPVFCIQVSDATPPLCTGGRVLY